MNAQYLQKSYFGGYLGDVIYGASHDLSNTMLAFAGYTNSPDFPVLNPINGQSLGNGEGFLLVLRTFGTSILRLEFTVR